MRYCKECGEQCKDTDKFCWKCGAKFNEKLPAKKNTGDKISSKETNPKAVGRITSNKKNVAKKPVALKLKKQKKKGQAFDEFNERKTAIYEMTSQDNCGECGCKNCMQFAMQAASPNNNMELSDCPYIDEDEAEEFNNSLESVEDKPTAKKQAVKKPAVKKPAVKRRG